MHYADALSFYHQIDEIFVGRGYDFVSDTPAPRILDCGGNIGTSVRRFRMLYPQANITVFEADDNIAQTLAKNLLDGGDSLTKLIRGAVWSASGKVGFAARGADVGRVDQDSTTEIDAHDIAEQCSAPVDLLKLDIEGGESEVAQRLVDSGAIDNVRAIAGEYHATGDVPMKLHDLLVNLHRAGMQYMVTSARSSNTMNPARSDSPFPAIPFKGSLAHFYAWRC